MRFILSTLMFFLMTLSVLPGPRVYASAPIQSKAKGKPMKLAYNEVQVDFGQISLKELRKPLDAALKALMHPDDELESPLNNALAVLGSKATGSDADKLDQARQYLSDHFNRATTQLVLLSGDREKDEEEGRGFAPERG